MYYVLYVYVLIECDSVCLLFLYDFLDLFLKDRYSILTSVYSWHACCPLPYLGVIACWYCPQHLMKTFGPYLNSQIQGSSPNPTLTPFCIVCLNALNYFSSLDSGRKFLSNCTSQLYCRFFPCIFLLEKLYTCT